MTILRCAEVSKRYINGRRVVSALENVTFEAGGGDFVSIVGRSGSGKSTLLKLIAGIENPTSGSIEVSSGEETKIGMVFQNNSVFPWKTVEGNLTFSLKISGASAQVRESEAVRIATMVGLEPKEFLSRFPRDLSGGELRRLAIGMTLAAGASLLLFDEPTSQLDYLAKYQIGQTVQTIWLAQRFTALYVTHDIDEAILLGDRVLLMDAGTVKDRIDIDLPRPRARAMIESPAFLQLRRTVLERFER